MEFNEIHLERIRSTNDYGRAHIDHFDPHKITLIRADEQTAGRGRSGKCWHSAPKRDLLLSFCFALPLNQRDLPSLGQMLSFTVAIVCRSLGLKPALKWPNDVQIDQKKVAGILCETVTSKEGIQVILGLGLNVNAQENDLANIDQPCTSLSIETGHSLDLEALLTLLKREFAKDLQFFIEQGFAPFFEAYQDMLSLTDRVITVVERGRITKGLCKGISEDGRLLVETLDGQTTAIISGEIQKNL